MFAALALVALLSPPGSSEDEWFHVGTIWCGHGERDPYCGKGIEDGVVDVRVFVGVRVEHCTNEARSPCPPLIKQMSQVQLQPGLYPQLFHFVLSWFVLPSVSESVVLMRVISALLLSIVFAVAAWLLPLRHRVVLLMVFLTVLTTYGYVLLASINPSSWAVTGVGVGWLTMHAALAPGDLSAKQRAALVSVSLLTWTIAIGSRWDAASFVALTAFLTFGQLAWVHFTHVRMRLVLVVTLLGLVMGASVQALTPLNPLKLFKDLFEFGDGEPDNLAFVSQHLLRGLPDALTVLGSTPTYPRLILPGFVFPVALVSLGFFMLQTFNKRNPWQLAGFITASMAISLLYMFWHSLRNERDALWLSPRYSLPLLVFAVGWWYLSGPSDLPVRVARYFRAAAVAATVLFALTIFTFAERNVDVQTMGLRLLPEGLDQWWWVWMPVGPNVVVVLATVCMWMFFSSFVRSFLVARAPTSS